MLETRIDGPPIISALGVAKLEPDISTKSEQCPPFWLGILDIIYGIVVITS